MGHLAHHVYNDHLTPILHESYPNPFYSPHIPINLVHPTILPFTFTLVAIYSGQKPTRPHILGIWEKTQASIETHTNLRGQFFTKMFSWQVENQI